MAIDKILHVLNHSKAKKSHKLVLVEIANRTNRDGLAWPSYATLASATGLTRSWVIRIVAELQAVGELEVVVNGSPKGGRAYRIPTGIVSIPGMKSLGIVSSQEVVYSVDPNLLNTESIYCQNDANDKNEWLTPEQAVKIGLTLGSRLYKKATGALPVGE